MGFLFSKLISAFLLPPFNALLLALIGLYCLKKRPRLGRGLILISLLAIALLSLPLTAHYLEKTLPHHYSAFEKFPDHDRQKTAIVILGAGLYEKAPEYGEDTLGGHALERARYGAKLHRETGGPILVAGGRPTKTELSEGEAMKRVLTREFHVPVRWVEDRSNTTFENAKFSYEMLSREGIDHILLVTHASHMPRAQSIFEKSGFTVIPAPTMLPQKQEITLFHLIPSAGALSKSSFVFHEWIGRLWYWMRTCSTASKI